MADTKKSAVLEGVIESVTRSLFDEVKAYATDALKHRKTMDAESQQHIVTFGYAMVLLETLDPDAWDFINDFQRSLNPTDQKDFQVHAARIGKGDKETADYLRMLYTKLGQNAPTRQFLTDIGAIGDRAIDPMERIVLISKTFGGYAKTGAEAFGKAISTGFKDMDAHLASKKNSSLKLREDAKNAWKNRK